MATLNFLAARWLQTVPTLRAVSLRVAHLRDEFQRRPPDELAPALNTICQRAAEGAPRARDVLAAVAIVFQDPALAKHLEPLVRLAAQDGLFALARLLQRDLTGDERRGDAPPTDERFVPPVEGGRSLTLGERRALARRPTRAAFEKLLRDPHPMVIRLLLDNPKLTEDDVVRIASRRPSYPDVIVEIARHPAFSQRTRVRMAILQNPSTPPDVALPLLPLLLQPELKQLAHATDIAPSVRAAASELSARKARMLRPIDREDLH